MDKKTEVKNESEKIDETDEVTNSVNTEKSGAKKFITETVPNGMHKALDFTKMAIPYALCIGFGAALGIALSGNALPLNGNVISDVDSDPSNDVPFAEVDSTTNC